MVAPAARIFSTAAAWVRAGACAASQSGLPPPVRDPAMSYMSLTTALSPASGPDGLPTTGAARSCGTKKEVVTCIFLLVLGSPHRALGSCLRQAQGQAPRNAGTAGAQSPRLLS